MAEMTTITWGELEIGHVVKGGMTVTTLTPDNVFVTSPEGATFGPYKRKDPWEPVEVETLSVDEVREFFNATPVSEEVDGEVRYFAWPDDTGFTMAAQSHLARHHHTEVTTRDYDELRRLHDELHAAGADHTHIDRKD